MSCSHHLATLRRKAIVRKVVEGKFGKATELPNPGTVTFVDFLLCEILKKSILSNIFELGGI